MQVGLVESVGVSEEIHEVVGREFGPCGGFLLDGGLCSSVRRFAIRRLHIGLYCGLGPQAHKLSWLPNLPWAKPADFVEPGPFAGWVPEGAFPSRRRERKHKRRGGWDFSENVRNEFEVRVRQRDAKCMACKATWFRGERKSTDALAWLRTSERSGLYVEVCDALMKMVPKPTALDPTWYERLPTDLRLEVKYRFDDSRLRAAHPLSLAFLRAVKLREGGDFSAAVQRFGVDGLALPLCDRCSREKGPLVFETRDELLARWAAYRFSGSVAAARSHPDYACFDYLARLAYQTDLVAALTTASHQRERRA
jgi:hypothetical protein